MGFKFPWSKKKEVREEYQPEVKQEERQENWNVNRQEVQQENWNPIRQETPQEQPAKRGVSGLTEQEIYGVRSMLDVKGELEAMIFVQKLTGASLEEAQTFVKKLASEARYARQEEDAKLASFGEESDNRDVLQQKALDSLSTEEIAELKQVIKERGAVVAIKMIREKTGVGLYEAKQYTDRLSEELR